MVTTCYAVKGGSGTTVVAAGLALGPDRTADRPVVLIDLDGDLALALGVPTTTPTGTPTGTDRPGVGDWLESDAPPDHLLDLAVEVADGVGLVPAGHDAGGHHDRWERFAAWLADGPPVDVVVDAGLIRPDRPVPGPLAVVGASHRRVLVTRPCYLALDRARRAAVTPTSVVVVDEPGRSLRRSDVQRSVGAPVVAVVPWDPRIARAVDAGLVRYRRLPRSLLGVGSAIRGVDPVGPTAEATTVPR
jgi:hypothetical protein